ncbi:MAG: hypothetical protein H6557_22730 [Lewinellaceae bacterium]|nr:hypothetical protein [Phaeodactylibacter sp.]MCB9039441.1 hypothetical protein [Lewinellaceae bacterium]
MEIPNTMASAQTIAVKLILPDTISENLPFKAALEITNRGSEKMKLISPSHNAALNFVVFDQFWNTVPANSVGKAHSAAETLELLPAQSFRFEFESFTFTTGTARMTFRLKPGIYYLLAIYHPGTDTHPQKSSYPVAVPSNLEKVLVI